jgi:choline dehydrogenase-like flavoprotein
MMKTMNRWFRWAQRSGAGIVRRPNASLRAEIVVVGSGPGGAVTACALAEAGRDVLLVEEGPHLPLESCQAFSAAEMVQKYRNGGLTVALGRAKVAYVEGRCVGGGSEVNSGIYHRIPPSVLHDWRRDFAVEALSEADLRPHYEACETDLSVSRVPGSKFSPASLKLHAGAQKLGWKSIEPARCYRYETLSSSDAIPTGTKQSMTKTYIPRALAAGCRLLPNTRVRSLQSRAGRWWLRAHYRSTENTRAAIEIDADVVFVAAGAIQTPALLRRSAITANVGNNLQMHPTLKVVARFPETVTDAAMAVPVHQVKEFAPHLTFGCSVSTPPYLALALNDQGGHRETEPSKAAVYYVMVSGDGRGRVRPLPFFDDPLVRYRVAADDLQQLAEGLRSLCRLLLEAGATELYPALPGAARITAFAELDRLPATIAPASANLMTIHLFSSCPMGENRRVCATDSFGRVHGCRNLYVADASLLCSSPGVNPQGGIMAVARRNAFAFLSAKAC